jgi:hypothetical protein
MLHRLFQHAAYARVLYSPAANFTLPFLLLVQALFEQILAGLLSRIAEGNGRVQEAACSSLAELLEHAGACTHGAVLVPRVQVNCCCVQLHGAAA